MAEEKPCFLPLANRAASAMARAMGIDTSNALSVSLEVGSPGEAALCVRFPVNDAAMAAMLAAVRALPAERASGLAAGDPADAMTAGRAAPPTDVAALRAEVRAIRVSLERATSGVALVSRQSE